MGVRTSGIVEHAIGQPVLDDGAGLHDEQSMGEQAGGDGQVVGHHDRGQTEVGHQSAEEVEQSGLHGDVEAACGLVEKHQAGTGGEGASQLQALLHAARELPGQIVHAVGGDLHACGSQSSACVRNDP